MTRSLLLVASVIGRAMEFWLSTCRRPLTAEVAALRERNERLRAENELLRARLKRLDPRRRPRFRPAERLAILWHRARYGLSLEATALAFVVSAQTLVNWLCSVEEGVRRLVTTREPMNKLPELVREIAARLRFEWPAWGTRRIAGILARLGLKGSRSSVQRILRRRPPPRRKLVRARKGAIHSKYPGHLVFVDFTCVKSFFRSVVIGAVLDGFSRKILSIRACRGEPTAAFACSLVRDAVERHGAPKWIVTDQGTQFTSLRFTSLLATRGIRRRFGAVGRSQSVAKIDRLWKSLKTETGDGLSPWRSLAAIDRKLSAYKSWYNAERPHQSLRQRTPDDVWHSRREARERSPTRGVLLLRYVGGDPRLPALRLRTAS